MSHSRYHYSQSPTQDVQQRPCIAVYKHKGENYYWQLMVTPKEPDWSGTPIRQYSIVRYEGTPYKKWIRDVKISESPGLLCIFTLPCAVPGFDLHRFMEERSPAPDTPDLMMNWSPAHWAARDIQRLVDMGAMDREMPGGPHAAEELYTSVMASAYYEKHLRPQKEKHGAPVFSYPKKVVLEQGLRQTLIEHGYDPSIHAYKISPDDITAANPVSNRYGRRG